MNRKSVDDLEDAARAVIEKTSGSGAMVDRQLNLTAKQLLERLEMISTTYGGGAA